MAKDTPLEWRKLNIYSVFLRNFSSRGDFDAVHSHLDRIKYLGTDVIWFLPFYPVGETNRKGSAGSPYAIKDHRKIDSSYGTMDHFQLLVDEIHKRGMKVMIDIVFSHTAPDSVLAQEHPEWLQPLPDDSRGERVRNWSDIVELDYSNRDLWNYQLETLLMWAELVDGFRCDRASLVPLEFWQEARARVGKTKPHFIWLSESVQRDFISYLRAEELVAHSDSELYQAFDLTYSYDTFIEYKDYLDHVVPLSTYVQALNMQDSTYPDNYVKLHFLENHDQERIVNALENIVDLVEWTAFCYFKKGAILVYNGQEVGAGDWPSLFDEDPIDWTTGIDLTQYMCHLARIKKKVIPVKNVPYYMKAYDKLDTVVMYYEGNADKRVGVFNLKHHNGKVRVDVPDGEYVNLINTHAFEVRDSKVSLADTPIFFIAPNE